MRIVVAMGLLFCSTAIHSQSISPPEDDNEGPPLALWEVGAGVGAALTPDYPSASNKTFRAIPFPVVIYRGDFIRIGDGSVASGRLFENDRIELDLSLNGSFNAESDDVEARVGMPDLGFIAEVGPEIEILLSDPGDGDQRLKLEVPVRAAFSLDDRKLNARGFVFSPQLEYERDFANDRYEWSVSITPSFATERLHDYFYEVQPEFETATRGRFDAGGGYLRTSLGLGLQRRSKKTFAAIGINYNFLGGAANEDSPLFDRDNEFSIAAVVIYRLWESEKRAPRRGQALPEKKTAQ
ncbi:MAG: MipA/OmpV family protein [Pseudomonadota bacterium]